jgi:hypothetical protein
MEVTHEMIRAAAESRAKDDEGEFEPLMDLLGFSGQNKTHTVIHAALVAATEAALRADMSGTNYEAWARSLIGFIRAKGLEDEYKDWCGGWSCPIAKPYMTGTVEGYAKRALKRTT